MPAGDKKDLDKMIEEAFDEYTFANDKRMLSFFTMEDEDHSERDRAYAAYLNDGIWSTLADTEAERTKASRQVRPWALLCRRMGWPVRLFEIGALSVSNLERRVVEHKVMMYAFSLHEGYASATVERYVGDLMALQKVLCGGISYHEMGHTLTRVRAMVKVFKRRKPGVTHAKVPFQPGYFGQIAIGQQWAGNMLTAREWATMAERHTWSMAVLADEHAYRLAELAKTRIPKFISAAPSARHHRNPKAQAAVHIIGGLFRPKLHHSTWGPEFTCHSQLAMSTLADSPMKCSIT